MENVTCNLNGCVDRLTILIDVKITNTETFLIYVFFTVRRHRGVNIILFDIRYYWTTWNKCSFEKYLF